MSTDVKGRELQLTEEDGYAALHEHVASRARVARERYGALRDEDSLRRLFADREIVRFPTAIEFSEEGLLPGEFAWLRPLGEKPTDGFTLVVHPCFEDRWDVLPALCAYHVVAIDYLDVATREEAELFGATLLDMDVEAYYRLVCDLADQVPGAPEHDPDVVARFDAATADGAQGGCNCHGAETCKRADWSCT